MKGIITIIIGYILILFDIPIVIKDYPMYEYSSKLGRIVQENIISNYYGGQLKIDVLSDIIGYLLLMFGAITLIKYSKRSLISVLFNIVTCILSVMTLVVPFYLQSDTLCIMALLLIISTFVCGLLGEYYLFTSIGKITNAKKNAHANNIMMLGWYASILCRVCMLFAQLYGLRYIELAYFIAYIGAATLFLVMIFKLRYDMK